MRSVVKEQFKKYKDVKDQRVIDLLIFKGRQELEVGVAGGGGVAGRGRGAQLLCSWHATTGDLLRQALDGSCSRLRATRAHARPLHPLQTYLTLHKNRHHAVRWAAFGRTISRPRRPRCAHLSPARPPRQQLCALSAPHPTPPPKNQPADQRVPGPRDQAQPRPHTATAAAQRVHGELPDRQLHAADGQVSPRAGAAVRPVAPRAAGAASGRERSTYPAPGGPQLDPLVTPHCAPIAP
jgi:hypothetical protein